MDNNKNTARVCYWVQNLVNNKRSELQEIADAPKWACKTDYGELEYQEFRHYFNVTAGDYDGDGKMTAVITYAGSDDLWGIAGTGIAGEQAFYRRSFAGADTYFGGWETTEYEKIRSQSRSFRSTSTVTAVMNLRLSPAPPSRSLTAAVCCPGSTAFRRIRMPFLSQS